jgi:hypothetical protein
MGIEESSHVQPRATAGQWLGSYELIEPIGAGGMGEVWRALWLTRPAPFTAHFTAHVRLGAHDGPGVFTRWQIRGV